MVSSRLRAEAVDLVRDSLEGGLGRVGDRDRRALTQGSVDLVRVGVGVGVRVRVKGEW